MKTPQPKRNTERSTRRLMAVNDADKVVEVTVGNSPILLENINERGIAITNERGRSKVMNDAGIAIAGTAGNAKVGKAGLAYVSSGDATGGPNCIAITRGAGTALVGDGGVAVAMRGGNASVVRGVAVAFNARGDYKARAMGYLGAVLVFSYTKDKDPNTEVEFVTAKVDNENIQSLVPYRVTNEGKIVRAESCQD